MTEQTEQGTEAAPDLADPIANFRFQAEVADGLAPWMQVRTETAKAVLAALDSARDQPPTTPVAIEVTYGHQAYIFSQVKQIAVQPAPEGANYSLECAWHTDGTLTIVPSCSIRMVGQDELDQIHADAEQRAEEADIMRCAGAEPDDGKDLDHD